MISMYLAVGYNCNHKCFFCPCGTKENKTKAASKEQMLESIREGIEKNAVDHITLSGGEPTIHPDFHEILKYCTEQRIRVSILSNGDTFSKVENVNRFFDEIDPSYFSITTAIHSHLPELHDKVTGVRGSHERTVQGLKNLIPRRIPFTVKQVISKWNYRYLPDFVDFVYKEYGPFASLTLCGMDFCGMNEEEIKEVAVAYNEIKPYLEKALDMVISIRQQFGAFPQVTVTDLPLCCVDPYYWGFFTKVSRNVLPRYSAPQDVNENIVSTNNVEAKCYPYYKKCTECCVEQLCPGIWESAYQYFNDAVVHSIKSIV